MEALVINWTALVFFYSNQASTNSPNSDKAKGFLKLLLDGKFLARCHAYRDILRVASITCKAIQASKTMNIAHALTKLSQMNIEFSELKHTAGENEEEILNKFQSASSTPVANRVYPTVSTRGQRDVCSITDQKEIYLL